MKLSLCAEHALLLLIHLTRQGDRGSSKIQAMAISQGISTESLKKILEVLTTAKYIDKEKDGYHLAQRAGKISVAEIIRLFDGALAPHEPISEKGYDGAPIEKEEKLSALFASIQDQISNRLEKTMIADLA